MWRVFCCKEIQWQNGMREENRKRKKDIFHLEMALNYHLYLVGKSIEIKFRKRVFFSSCVKRVEVFVLAAAATP